MDELNIFSTKLENLVSIENETNKIKLFSNQNQIK